MEKGANQVFVVREGEIDFVSLGKLVWSKKNHIIRTTFIFITIGLVIAFTTPEEYDAYCKLLPESSEDDAPSIGGLGNLAGLAGIDLNMRGTESLSPILYPEIASGLPFVLDIMNDTLHFKQDHLQTTAFDYFENHASSSLLGYLLSYTIGLPGKIKGLFFSEEETNLRENQEFYYLSKKDWELVQDFKERIVLSIDEESGLIYINVQMPDPYAAAEIARKVQNEVTRAVVDYKTDKLKKNLEFVEESFSDAKAEFQKIQLKLAEETDRNRDVSSARGQIELKNIQNEYNVAFEVYKGLASQVEQAKLKLKEQTPVFTVLEPIRIPADNSEPNRPLILVAFAFLGAVSSILYILVKSGVMAQLLSSKSE